MNYVITVKDGLITAVHESMTEITEETFTGTEFAGQEVRSVPSGNIQAGLHIGEYTAEWELRPLSERVAEGYLIIPDGYQLMGEEILPIPEEPETPEPTAEEIAYREIISLKAQLAESDYKITKAYEYTLVGLEIPYDIPALHAERQAIRDLINEKEGV